jgi:hypothetical protein
LPAPLSRAELLPLAELADGGGSWEEEEEEVEVLPICSVEDLRSSWALELFSRSSGALKSFRGYFG